MIITISGYPGAGKTNGGKFLAGKLNYEFFSVGKFRRDQAKKRGILIQEYNELGETDSSTDREADEYQKKLGEESDNFIFEGRLSFHFIPNSMKIFLMVDPKVGAERIFLEKRDSENSCKTIEEQLKQNTQRIKSDIKRYSNQKLPNPYILSYYDFIFDTSKSTIPEVCEIILKETAKYR